MSELKILIEAQLQNQAEIEFAHHFCEEVSNLHLILHGNVNARLCRIESGELCGEMKWKDSLITLVAFKPTYVDPRRSELYGGVLGTRRAILSWKDWFPTVLKPAAARLAQDELQKSISVFWNLDAATAKRLDGLLREIHPEWFYMWDSD